MMTAKENAIRIIRFEPAEYISGGPPCHAVKYLGCDHEGYNGGGHHLPVGSKWEDIWGTVWHREHEGVMGFPRGNPLADLPNAIGSYRWPDPADERLCGLIYTTAGDQKKDDAFLAGRHRDTLWEKSYMLVGMEDLMCYFLTEPAAVKELLRRIMDFQMGMAQHYLKAGVEMVFLGDDLGTQSGLLLSPEIVNEFLVPEYRRLFDFYRSRGILINFHSCGHIEPLLETFIALGVNILNPVQATANNLDNVRRITHKRMALQGGVSTGTIMNGPPEKIRHEVAQRMWQLGRNGGYFCAPDQGMPFPEANLAAFRNAVAEFGKYPLHAPG
jgi:uroporphyrinogen decarboxylase